MNLERLTRKALDARELDAGTLEEIQSYIARRSHLDAEEYEALRRLGRSVRSGEVRQSPAPARVP